MGSPPESYESSVSFYRLLGNKRLILDLRYINMHLYKDKTKLMIGSVSRTIYHQITFTCSSLILKMVIIILAFSIPIKYISAFLGISKGLQMFCSHCPTLWLILCTIFTKVVPLVKHWRLHAIKIACFLDDGLGIAYTYQDALSCSNLVERTLINSGFVPIFG